MNQAKESTLFVILMNISIIGGVLIGHSCSSREDLRAIRKMMEERHKPAAEAIEKP